MAVASPLNLNGVSQGVKSLKRGLGNVGTSVDGIKKILLNRTTVKRQAITSRQMLQNRRAENVRRRDQEDILEASGIRPTVRRTQTAIVDNTKGFLGRLMDFIGTLFVGWLLYNLPTLIVLTQDLIKRIQTLFTSLTGFIGNLMYVFWDIGRIFTGVLDDIAHFDFLDSRRKVQSAFDDLNTHFDNMGKQFEDGVKSVTTPLGQGAGEQQIPSTGASSGPEFGDPGYSPTGGYAAAGLSGTAKSRVGKDTAFLGEVKRVAQKYNIKEGDLLGLMASESGLNPAAGEVGGYVGLIQFSPDSAKSVGTTQQALIKMSRAEQMKYVDKYFENHGLKKGAGAGQLYTSVFAPAYAGASDPNKVLYSSPSREYAGNRELDLNRDKKITIAEMGARIEAKKKEFGISDDVSIQSTETTGIEASGNVISVGKSIVNQGFAVAENKYFTKFKGFNPKGDSHVGKHASSDHATNALDVTDWRGSAASGVPRLKNLFLSLYSNRSSLGIKALIYDPIGYWFTGMKDYARQAYGGHGDHLHVGFTKSADTALKSDKDLGIIALGQGQGQNVSSAITPERKGPTVAVVDNRQPQQPTPSGGGGGGGPSAPPPIPSSDTLNSFIKQNLLLDLAYT